MFQYRLLKTVFSHCIHAALCFFKKNISKTLALRWECSLHKWRPKKTHLKRFKVADQLFLEINNVLSTASPSTTVERDLGSTKPTEDRKHQVFPLQVHVKG